MDAKFCCLPLPGKDLLPSDRKAAIVAHLAEQAKAELHFVVEMCIDAAQPHVGVVNEQYPRHGMNHPILIALLLKRRIRLKCNTGTVPLGTIDPEQKSSGEISQ